jgi:prepilin signal peptidase PulO-like enzyme (type II secretory pathway)
MTSHVGLMIVFALFVSTVFATLMRDTLREQVRFGLRLFAGFIAAALAMGWLMYVFPL